MIEIIHTRVLPAALGLLPPAMDTPEARAMLLAIGLQESRFEHRRQVKGPARGFWQFEYGGGLAGVMTHRATRGHLDAALCALRYDGAIDEPARLFVAIEHNDVVACVCARLLLWTLPGRLPARPYVTMAWNQYIDAWRPGQPHVETWADYYLQAWELVDPTSTSSE
jgi:hypothetical protein